MNLIIFQPFLEKLAKETDPDKKAMHERTKVKVEAGLEAAKKQQEAATNNPDLAKETKDVSRSWHHVMPL